MIFVTTRNPIFAVLFIFLIVISCKSRSYNDESKSKGFFDFFNGGKSFDSEVVDKRKCTPEYNIKHKFLEAKSATKFFHWTNDPLALTSPYEYMSSVVKNSNAVNNELNKNSNAVGVKSAVEIKGHAGAGLYIAPNPFVSSDFGSILVVFDIKMGTRFAILEKITDRQNNQGAQEALEAQVAHCPSIIYPYAAKVIGKTESAENKGKAIVMWDLGSIDSTTVQSFGPQSEGPFNFGPGFEQLLKSREKSVEILMAESNKRAKIPENIAMLNDIRKYWEEQPSLYDWQ